MLGDAVRQVLQTAEARLLDFLQLGLMLLDHSLVVFGSDDRETLGKQVVVRVSWTDFNHFALFADVVDILDKHQFDATIWALGESLENFTSCTYFC